MNTQKLMPMDIVREVCGALGVSVEDMQGAGRSYFLVDVRTIVAVLLLEYFGFMTHTMIAALIGRERSAVSELCRRRSDLEYVKDEAFCRRMKAARKWVAQLADSLAVLHERQVMDMAYRLGFSAAFTQGWSYGAFYRLPVEIEDIVVRDREKKLLRRRFIGGFKECKQLIKEVGNA